MKNQIVSPALLLSLILFGLWGTSCELTGGSPTEVPTNAATVQTGSVNTNFTANLISAAALNSGPIQATQISATGLTTTQDVSVGGNFTTEGTISTMGDLVVGGDLLTLGSGSTTPDTGNSRALEQSSDGKLLINSGGDFFNGTEIQGSSQNPNLYIGASSPKVGINTRNPLAMLHLLNGGAYVQSSGSTSPSLLLWYQGGTTTNAAYLSFRRDNSLGAAQNGDALGRINFYGYDGTTYNLGARIASYADTSTGLSISGGTTAGNLIFYTTGTERMRISPDGEVGIGTATPTAVLHVQGNAKVSGTVTCTSLTQTSDRRQKEDIHEIGRDQANRFIEKAKPVHYRISASQKEGFGFIAQDILKLGFGGELVTQTEDSGAQASRDETGLPNPAGKFYGLEYSSIVPLLTKAIQVISQDSKEKAKALNAELEDLKTTIRSQGDEIQALRAELKALRLKAMK